MGTTAKESQYYGSGGSGVTYGGTGGRGGSRVNGATGTVVACTHHEGDSEEYIMNDLEGPPLGPCMGINKTMEIKVESEEIGAGASRSTNGRRNWA